MNRNKEVAPVRAHSSHQSGYILLWMLLFLGLLSAGTVAGWSRIGRVLNEDVTGQALSNAKLALLGYAAGYPEGHLKGSPERAAFVPGHLPCPDLETNNPGQEAPQCNSQGVSALGRLPWTTLGISPLTDSSGECLWYAVSGQYKSNPKANLLNPDIAGQFTLQAIGPNGLVTVAEDVVAVVIAPGPPLPGQTRPFTDTQCRSALLPDQYLDKYGTNNNALLNTSPEGNTVLVTARPETLFGKTAGESLNDRMVWITRQELFAAIQQRSTLKDGSALFDTTYLTASSDSKAALTQRVANCLRAFGLANPYKRLPWAAPLSISTAAPNTFQNDRFNDQKNLMAGRIPHLVWDSRKALGVAPSLTGLSGCNTSDSTSCRLFRSDNCADFLPVAGHPTPTDSTSNKDSPDGWFEKWKDHLFYAVASDFQPAAQAAGSCQDTSQCLDVNGRPYAAIVLYAGDVQSGQQRLTTANKLDINNYLEGSNATSVSTGGRSFAAAGNDRMVCLRVDLSLSMGCTD